jgi:hypothetical protein
MTKPNCAVTPTTASLATTLAFTPNPTSEIQSLQEEYVAKLHSTTTEIAELKSMLQHVINTLHALRVQGAPNPSTDSQLESDSTSTREVENMDICTEDTAQMVTPIWYPPPPAKRPACTSAQTINLLPKRSIFATDK